VALARGLNDMLVCQWLVGSGLKRTRPAGPGPFRASNPPAIDRRLRHCGSARPGFRLQPPHPGDTRVLQSRSNTRAKSGSALEGNIPESVSAFAWCSISARRALTRNWIQGSINSPRAAEPHPGRLDQPTQSMQFLPVTRPPGILINRAQRAPFKQE
jgi:hypothetical protein